MIGRRDSPDGLPFRLYKRSGKFKVSFGYKLPSGKWAFSLSAPTNNPEAVATVRREAIERAEILNGVAVAPGTVADLVKRYFAWQKALPTDSEMRKAKGTLDENEVEAKNLNKVFGKMAPRELRAKDIYGYLEFRAEMGAPAKANKEIALLSAVIEFGRRKGEVETNPCRDIKYNKTRPSEKYVEWKDVAYAVTEARVRKGSYLVCALCVLTAYMAVGRPTEMRGLTRQSIVEEGIRVPIGKRKRGEAQRYKLIEWSPELRATIDEAIRLQRTTSIYIFGNTSGQIYTRSGWNTIWTRLMKYCEAKAISDEVTFTRFALTHMRPTSVTDRLDDEDPTTRSGDASGHSGGRMVAQVYDRRRVKKSKATPIKS
jgi:integrase